VDAFTEWVWDADAKPLGPVAAPIVAEGPPVVADTLCVCEPSELVLPLVWVCVALPPVEPKSNADDAP
jgi:hypothetical protein